MKYFGVLIILIAIFVNSIYGQDKDSIDNFLNRVTLRKSFESKNDKAEPAIIAYTNPKNKVESWLLNAAIGVNVLPRIELHPYFEYHKNTLVDKEQDNWQTGLSLEWQLQDMSSKNWTPILISSVKYNKDNVKNISSFQGNYYCTPLFKGKELNPNFFWLPNTTVNFGKAFQFVYSPYIGLENENRISTESDSTKGNICRAYFRITSNILLFPSSGKFKEKFEFNLDWQYRYNLQENIQDLTKSEHNFFTASFNYVFFTADEGGKSAKIGLDYINGENPTKNFEEQSYYAVSLKIKL